MEKQRAIAPALARVRLLPRVHANSRQLQARIDLGQHQSGPPRPIAAPRASHTISRRARESGATDRDGDARVPLHGRARILHLLLPER